MATSWQRDPVWFRGDVAAGNLLTTGEFGGQNDTYGFALAAHPGKSQGRPVTPAGSQPIGILGLLGRVLPEPLSRNAPNLRSGPDAPSDSGAHSHAGTPLPGT
jgi:hypothetical protein